MANGIAAISFFMWMLIIEKFAYLSGKSENAVQLAHVLIRGDALTAKKGALIRFIKLVQRRMGLDAKLERLSEVAQVCAMEYDERLKGSLPLIQTLCALAPLVGLLGTVDGMMLTFSALSDPSQEGGQRLATGVSQALITTEMGLVVAVPGLLALSILKKKSEMIQHQVQQILFVLQNHSRKGVS